MKEQGVQCVAALGEVPAASVAKVIESQETPGYSGASQRDGADCPLEPYVYLKRRTPMGDRNEISAGAVLGADLLDKALRGELKFATALDGADGLAGRPLSR